MGLKAFTRETDYEARNEGQRAATVEHSTSTDLYHLEPILLSPHTVNRFEPLSMRLPTLPGLSLYAVTTSHLHHASIPS